MKPAELYTHTHTHTHTHTQLRRCLAFLLFIIIPYNSFAVDACAPNDTVAIVLDPSVGSQGDSTYDGNFSYNINTMTWQAPYSHVTYYGVAACLSSNYEMSKWGIYSANNGILTDNGQVVKGGEENGTHCWCKLTYPIGSLWIYVGADDYQNGLECRTRNTANWTVGWSSCSQRCVGSFKNRPVMRANLFNSVQ